MVDMSRPGASQARELSDEALLQAAGERARALAAQLREDAAELGQTTPLPRAADAADDLAEALATPPSRSEDAQRLDSPSAGPADTQS